MDTCGRYVICELDYSGLWSFSKLETALEFASDHERLLTDNGSELRPRLDNGAIVLASRGRRVLASWRGGYVIWTRDVVNPGAVHGGDYFKSLSRAFQTFAKLR